MYAISLCSQTCNFQITKYLRELNFRKENKFALTIF